MAVTFPNLSGLGQYAKDNGNPNQGYNDVWNAFQTGVLAPYDAQAAQKQSQLGLQSGLIGANYGVQSGALSQQLSSGMANLGLDQNALGIQQGQLARQMGSNGLSQQNEALTQRQFGLSDQDLAAQREQANYGAGMQTRGAWSNNTARGSTNTSGFRQQLGDISQQLQFQLAGIGRNEQQLGIGKEREKLRFGEEQKNLDDAKQMLDIRAKKLGLSGQDLNARISQALGQLGIQQSLSTLDILNGMNDIENGRYNILGSVIGQVAAIDPGLLSRQQTQVPAGFKLPQIRL